MRFKRRRYLERRKKDRERERDREQRGEEILTASGSKNSRAKRNV